MIHSLEQSSRLAIQPSNFWTDATLADVNAELAPWVRMTVPSTWRSVPLRQWPAGRQLFRSWILLFGFLPVDLHFFFLQRIDPSSGFDELSSSLMNKRWEHSRYVTPQDDGCVLTDRVRYESRLPFAGRLLLPVYRAIFRSRHRYLQRKFGSPGVAG